MVEWESKVDHVLLVDTAQLVERLALQDLHMTDPSSLREACGVAQGGLSGGGSEPQALGLCPLPGIP